MSVLEVKDLYKNFGKTEVLKGVSFSMEKGEVLSIIGSSGSGKTTLLRCINFLEKANKGQILVDGEVIFDASNKDDLSPKAIRRCQLYVGLVFQSFNLFPQYSVLDNVTLAPMLLAKERPDYKRNKHKIAEEIKQEAISLLTRVGLADKLEN